MKVAYLSNAQLRTHIQQDDQQVLADYLEQGGDPNWKDPESDSLLINAIEDGKLWAVRMLLAHDVDIEQKDNAGDTPLLKAVIWGDTEFVDLLLEAGADITATGLRGESAVSNSLTFRNEKMTELLLNHHTKTQTPVGRKDDNNPLWKAATTGRELRLLESYEVDLGGVDAVGGNLLHHICDLGVHRVQWALDVLKQQDVDVPDDNGNTALMVAAVSGHHAMCEELLALGAQVDRVNHDGQDAWMMMGLSSERTDAHDIAKTAEVLARARREALAKIAKEKAPHKPRRSGL
jgi:ankyrin repeat protein